MSEAKSISDLKERIHKTWNDTRKEIKENIKRGHTRSISADVEDSIAIFISSVLDDEIDIYIDSSVRVDKKTHRPDILVVKDDKVIALMELKTNMGWCRNAEKVIDDEILGMHNKFINQGEIECKFSSDEKKSVRYDNNVKLYLIALTSRNGGKRAQIEKNIDYAKSKGVSHYLLFNGWYDSLTNRDIDRFSEELQSLKGQ